MTYPEQKELTLTQKVIGILFLLGFVVVMLGGVWAAFTTGRPLVPYNPDNHIPISQQELPWWMVD